jgi:UDP-GlcNAc:undecaprenyl-phosphate GlcNAc-1-phosphate transferase
MYEWMMFVDAMMGLLIPILVIVAIKVSVPFAGKLKLVDSPNSRKLHACDVAVVGGLGMFLGVAVGLMSGEYSYDGLVLFAFLMLVLGVLDDRHDLSIISRLFAQMILAICAVSVMGIELRLLGDILNTGNLVLGNFSLIITVLAFLAGTNSFNAIDGLDGLAAGLGIIIFSSILVLASISESNRIVYLAQFICLFYSLFCFLIYLLSIKYLWGMRVHYLLVLVLFGF